MDPGTGTLLQVCDLDAETFLQIHDFRLCLLDNLNFSLAGFNYPLAHRCKPSSTYFSFFAESSASSIASSICLFARWNSYSAFDACPLVSQVNILMDAAFSSAAATLASTVSADSMKKSRYCPNFLANHRQENSEARYSKNTSSIVLG